MDSSEFSHLLEFFDKHYGLQKELTRDFVSSVEARKDIIDYKQSSDFQETSVKRSYIGMPIFSTGGYNDQFLRFISNVFDTQIVKSHNFMQFVINAIDYLNKYTNDCFFNLNGEASGILNQCGKLKTGGNLKQHYFSLKEELYPYLLVNTRSGATFTLVHSKESQTRLCGTSIGSSFFWGMLRLLNYF